MNEYIKQNFTSGQILKAGHLNYMEEGIEQLSEEIKNLKNNETNGGDTTLRPATRDTLGGVMIGDGLNVDKYGRVRVAAPLPDMLFEITLEETVAEVNIPLNRPVTNLAVLVYPPESLNKSMYVYVYAGKLKDIETGQEGTNIITDAIIVNKSDYRAKISINVIGGVLFAYWDNLPIAHSASGTAKFANKTMIATNGKLDRLIVRSNVAGYELLKGTVIKVYGA